MEGYSNYVNAIIELLHLCTSNFRDQSLNIMESLNWVLTKRLVMALVQPSSLIDNVVNYLESLPRSLFYYSRCIYINCLYFFCIFFTNCFHKTNNRDLFTKMTCLAKPIPSLYFTYFSRGQTFMEIVQ